MKTLEEVIRSQLSISEIDLNEISCQFKSVKVNSGDVLISSGMPCKQLFFIKRGYLRVYALENGNEVTLWIVGEGVFITSLSSFIFQNPNHWFIEASTDCELEYITRENHFNLLKNSAKWMEFDIMLLSKSFAMLEERMYSHLYSSAKERLMRLQKNTPDLFQHIPQQHIASLIGVTPETLSRLRKKLL